MPVFDTAVPNSGFAIRASLPDFLCLRCRSFGSLYLPVVLTSPFVDAALQATGSSHPPHLQAAGSFHPPPLQAAESSHPPPLTINSIFFSSLNYFPPQGGSDVAPSLAYYL
ncbi:hypothetical protein TNIN_396421 [Trichonephila inaurata madagascariensis]|uniref:Uncharacterized protein n=1 Tax=Trichonephila inaurata madagascariensis TaxID=2747483 RepID=A0A8X6WQB7_9ARAC|nr:hypothetical protein TNIN_396421 [Trichonephila inaurata madagascariensis]